MPEPSIRAFAPHEWRTYKDLWLRALADSPDSFGSTLALVQTHPDEWWMNRLAQADDTRRNLALRAEIETKPVGLAWGKIEEPSPLLARIYHMWVAPEFRGQGAGRMLLEAVVAWAREAGADTLALGVTYGDTPAMRLYTSAGFKPIGLPEPCRPGSELLGLEMELTL